MKSVIKKEKMKSKIQNRKSKIGRGLTLIEIMIAILVIVIGVIGAMGFRYYCATSSRHADVQINCARVASLILEGWKAEAGRAVAGDQYNPANEITLPANMTITGTYPNYVVHLMAGSGVYYYAALSYQDLASPSNPPNIRELNVKVAWLKNYGSGGVTAEDWNLRSVSLKTYTRWQ